ncbi:hypothetical protein [Arthrobacter terrae]|uniref:hypothetical protein n=1 Tax=Arthrobacter terrae TaxID=2935737 RepID=UPI001E5BF1AB|nr:hypothetical protein [Arthrobacter terrae]
MSVSKVPVVFIHGLWFAASLWQPWIDLCAKRGFEPIAPALPAAPVIIGHSFGAMITEKPAVSLTIDQFRYSFGNALPPEESDALREQYSIPSPGKPLF